MQIVIPAWYSEDLSQEMQQLSLQADKLVPVLLSPRSIGTSQLLVSKGKHDHFSFALVSKGEQYHFFVCPEFMHVAGAGLCLALLLCDTALLHSIQTVHAAKPAVQLSPIKNTVSVTTWAMLATHKHCYTVWLSMSHSCESDRKLLLFHNPMAELGIMMAGICSNCLALTSVRLLNYDDVMVALIIIAALCHV